MQPIKYNSIRINACPTHNQCKIHEVFAFRMQDPTRAQEHDAMRAAKYR